MPHYSLHILNIKKTKTYRIKLPRGVYVNLYYVLNPREERISANSIKGEKYGKGNVTWEENMKEKVRKRKTNGKTEVKRGK